MITLEQPQVNAIAYVQLIYRYIFIYILVKVYLKRPHFIII